jgi:hypothetical protein
MYRRKISVLIVFFFIGGRQSNIDTEWTMFKTAGINCFRRSFTTNREISRTFTSKYLRFLLASAFPYSFRYICQHQKLPAKPHDISLGFIPSQCERGNHQWSRDQRYTAYHKIRETMNTFSCCSICWNYRNLPKLPGEYPCGLFKGRGRYFPIICSSAICQVHGIGAWELGKLAQGNLRYLPTYNTLIVRNYLKALFLNTKPISEGVSVKCFVFFRKVDVKWYQWETSWQFC